MHRLLRMKAGYDSNALQMEIPRPFQGLVMTALCEGQGFVDGGAFRGRGFVYGRALGNESSDAFDQFPS